MVTIWSTADGTVSMLDSNVVKPMRLRVRVR